MIIDRQYQIHKATAFGKSNAGRPVLGHVLVTSMEALSGLLGGDGDEATTQFQSDTPIAVATNGFILAVVPVELDEGDIPGPVQGSIFTEAFKGGKSVPVRMELGEERVNLPFRGMTLDRYGGGVAGDTKFPDFRPVIPVYGEDREAVTAIAFNNLEAKNLLLALGIKETVRLHLNTNTGPIGVTGNGSTNPWQPPFGVLMPMHFGR